MPTNFLNVSSKKIENQSAESAAPASVLEASAPSSTGTPESSNTNEEGKLALFLFFSFFLSLFFLNIVVIFLFCYPAGFILQDFKTSKLYLVYFSFV